MTDKTKKNPAPLAESTHLTAVAAKGKKIHRVHHKYDYDSVLDTATADTRARIERHD